MTLVLALTVFILAMFVGLEVISHVPSLLHTPLMSGSNAIHGVIIVGALIAAGLGDRLGAIAGTIALVGATINVVCGFLVTDRMLKMFRKGSSEIGDRSLPDRQAGSK